MSFLFTFQGKITFEKILEKIVTQIALLYQDHKYLTSHNDFLSDQFKDKNKRVDPCYYINALVRALKRFHQKDVIIFID